MEDKRILYVSSEVVPYLAENEVSLMSYEVPKMINDQGGQIRIFMPRYGNINGDCYAVDKPRQTKDPSLEE